MIMEHKMPTMPSTIPRRPVHTPAWKRIGLKLKLPQVQSCSLDTVIVEDNNLKRKATLLDCSDEKENKKTRITTEIAYQKAHEVTPLHPSTKKSVKFTPETKVEDGDSIKKLFKTWVAQQKPHHSPNTLFKSHEALDINTDSASLHEENDSKKSKKKRKLKDTKVSKQIKPQVTNQSMKEIPPFLSYLREYHESKETWKFKKNHQTHLLQSIFDVDKVPSNFAHLIYAYVRGLRGQVRTRLRDTAISVKVDDREKGMSGFPSELLNPEQRQKEYEAAIADYLTTTTTTSDIQQLGHEESFLSRFEDELMKSRIIRRIRAEMILTELASSPEGNEIDSIGVSKDKDSRNTHPESNPIQKKVRRRKKRTVVVEESSSDDSDSDSESNDGVLADTDTDQNKPNSLPICSSSSSMTSSDSD